MLRAVTIAVEPARVDAQRDVGGMLEHARTTSLVKRMSE